MTAERKIVLEVVALLLLIPYENNAKNILNTKLNKSKNLFKTFGNNE